jgi:spermidine synthase
LYRCGLAFGNTIWAVSIVLSSLMAGLAIGSALAGRLTGGSRRLLQVYAALELAVAAAGIALTYALPHVTPLLAAITSRLVEAPWLVSVVRLSLAFTLLALPATAMGATLPVLVGAQSGEHGFGAALGRLYGWNTLGAVVGVLGAELVFIGRFGVPGTAWVAAAADLVAATVVFLAARDLADERPLELRRRLAAPRRRASRLLACAFLAGASLMALEVVWFRFLTMFIVSTTTAASVMLAVVLGAIGLGSLLGSIWLSRRPEAAAWLPTVSVVAACASVASYAAFRWVTSGTQVAEWSRIVWFASALTFPTALLSGLMFTLMGQALKRQVEPDVEAAGWLVLANTTGAALGPLIAGFLLLPRLGMERSILGLALLHFAVGLLAASGADMFAQRSRIPRRAFAAASILGLSAAALFPFGIMASEYFPRASRPYTSEGEEVVATREGMTFTIFLMRQTRLGGLVYHRLVTNGYSMTGTSLAAERYMRYFAYWPHLLREAPIRRVLLVCYGMGITLQAITDLKSVESIDVVELSPEMVAMSDLVYPPAKHPLHDPRVRLRVEDGRHFLQTTRERFDLISGEPPPPLTPGTVSLYTREYFQLMHDRLNEGGVATYWLPVARHVGTDMMAVVRGFCDVFSSCSVWNGTPADLMLVGVRGELPRVSREAVAKPFTEPVVGERLREVGFESPEQIGATFVGDAPWLARQAAGTLALTDDFPQRLWLSSDVPPGEPRAVLDRGGSDYQRAWIDPVGARDRFEQSDFIRRLWPEVLREETLPFFTYQGGINRLLTDGADPLAQIEQLHLLLTRTTLRTLPAWMLGLGNLLSRSQGAATLPNDRTGRPEYFKGLVALVDRDYTMAVTSLLEAEKRGLAGVRTLLAYALCLAGRVNDANYVKSVSPPETPEVGRFWNWLETTFHLSAAPAVGGLDPRTSHRMSQVSLGQDRPRAARH